MKKINLGMMFLLIGSLIYANTLKLGSIASLGEEHGFWKSVRNFQEAVQNDLEIETIWEYAENNHFKARDDLEDLMKNKKVNAALVVNFKKQGEIFFNYADANRVPIITHVNGGDQKISGLPREKHKYWIGEIYIDEEKVGYELAKRLFIEAKKNGIKEIKLIGISGHQADILANIREAGMKRAAREHNVKLLQVLNTQNWSFKEGKQKIENVLHRYPETNVVWCANDDIALGVLEGVKKHGRTPGKDLYTGGIDWIPDALEKVKSGEMVCSVGALFYHAGFASVLLYDYLNGVDFADELGVRIETNVEVLSKDNIEVFLDKFGDNDWNKVNFKKFSKVLNPKLKKYDFTLDSLIENMEY